MDLNNNSNNLASYAVIKSLGRSHDELLDNNLLGIFDKNDALAKNKSNQFAYDRERIINCVAFRRLGYKTQVFVNHHENDLFRTRLTHTLEVAQIARLVARKLRLNEDLAEAIALAHDLGHTPFGHAGQDALNACMKDAGGFEHNRQSLLIVDQLEMRYAKFPGLNLSYETREGILKHCSVNNAKALGQLGQRFLLKQQPSLEAQLINVADEIAYGMHDIDDGLRSKLIDIDSLNSLPMWHHFRTKILERNPKLHSHNEPNKDVVLAQNDYNKSNAERLLIHETIRAMLNEFIDDLICNSAQNLSKLESCATVDTIRTQTEPLIKLSSDMRNAAAELKKFLFKNLYRHYKVMRMNVKAKHIITQLFEVFMADPRLLPPDYLTKDKAENQTKQVANYIAGMTDRYAMQEYQRLFTVGIL